MARFVTVQTTGTNFLQSNMVAGSSWWQSLQSAISSSGLNATIYLNEGGEYQSTTPQDVASLVRNGGIWIDYCGWPFFSFGQGSGGFEALVKAAGINLQPAFGAPYQAFPFAWSEYPYASTFQRAGYPYHRGLVTATAIGTVGGAPETTTANVNTYISLNNHVALVHLYSCFGLRIGRGWYFYAYGNGTSGVSPQTYANFIVSALGGRPSPGPGYSFSQPTQPAPPRGGQTSSPGGSSPGSSSGGGSTSQNPGILPSPTTPNNTLVIVGAAALLGIGVLMLAAGE